MFLCTQPKSLHLHKIVHEIDVQSFESISLGYWKSINATTKAIQKCVVDAN
jgi:hypothetical protein